MRAQLLKLWERTRTSFWFVPTLMIFAATALSFISVRLDETVTDEWLSRQAWAYTGGAESAATVLGTIAGSMITIAGVVFSLTLVALSLASSQFGPRLLRNFMSDTANQSVLGTFVATFLYCLLVLRTIRRPDEGDFVPHLSITLGLFFGVASLGVLVYFIHHVATSIQADQIISRVSAELSAAIDRLFPKETGRGVRDEGLPQRSLPAEMADSRPIRAAHDGYLQLIDTDALMEIATENDLSIQIERRPGHYVVEGTVLAFVAPADRATDEVSHAIRAVFVLGGQRSPAQDVEFSVHQLVEIALRALSPGINDPFTAITCIDRLGSALSRLASREMPSPQRRSDDGVVRVIAPPVSFTAILESALNQIRQHSGAHPAIAIRLLEMIAVVAPATHRADDRAALMHHAEMIERAVQAHVPEAHDLSAVAQRLAAAKAALRQR